MSKIIAKKKKHSSKEKQIKELELKKTMSSEKHQFNNIIKK